MFLLLYREDSLFLPTYILSISPKQKAAAEAAVFCWFMNELEFRVLLSRYEKVMALCQ